VENTCPHGYACGGYVIAGSPQGCLHHRRMKGRACCYVVATEVAHAVAGLNGDVPWLCCGSWSLVSSPNLHPCLA
jgi:hypothetical protein